MSCRWPWQALSLRQAERHWHDDNACQAWVGVWMQQAPPALCALSNASEHNVQYYIKWFTQLDQKTPQPMITRCKHCQDVIRMTADSFFLDAPQASATMCPTSTCHWLWECQCHQIMAMNPLAIRHQPVCSTPRLLMMGPGACRLLASSLPLLCHGPCSPGAGLCTEVCRHTKD